MPEQEQSFDCDDDAAYGSYDGVNGANERLQQVVAVQMKRLYQQGDWNGYGGGSDEQAVVADILRLCREEED